MVSRQVKHYYPIIVIATSAEFSIYSTVFQKKLSHDHRDMFIMYFTLAVHIKCLGFKFTKD